MGFVSWVRKFHYYYKNKGFFWLCRHIVKNLVNYRKWVVIETRIHKDIEKVEAKIPVTIRLLSRSEEDIRRLTEFWPDIYAPVISNPQNIRDLIIEHLSAGEECMIAEYHGDIIHMNWIGFNNRHIFESYEKKRGLRDGEAISHRTYCADEYRNNRLMTAVRYRILDYLENNNYKILLSYIRSDNVPAVKVNQRFGGKVVQIFHFVSLLAFKFSLISRKRT